MDLFLEMLTRELPKADSSIDVDSIRLPLKKRLGRVSGNAIGSATDRLLARHLDYPRAVRRRTPPADVYHVLDHTYAASINSLGDSNTVVTCHDLDAFEVLYSQTTFAEHVLAYFARITLRGLKSATHVVCDSATIQREIVSRGWVESASTSLMPAGIHPACTVVPSDAADRTAESLLGPATGPEILHVSSTIPRKRIDTVVRSFASVLGDRPDARLIRVGGPFTESQARMVSELGLEKSITVLPFLDRATLAAVYRRATLVILPSEREGFGLPVIEAMACGTAALVSDIEVLREVGESAVSYAPVGDDDAWATAVLGMLDEHDNQPQRWSKRIAVGITHARQYSWSEHARQLSQLYHSLAAH
ncbi:MAG: glycosyltransferase family 1 protein [Gemmatimonadaceae bacterium]